MTPHRDRLLAGDYEAGGTRGVDAEDLDSMTKDELLSLAGERGLPVTSASTKAEIRAALEGGG